MARGFETWVHRRVRKKIDDINSQVVAYFTRGDSMPTLNGVALYVLQNEHSNQLKVVHAYQREEDIPADLASHLSTIDHLYLGGVRLIL